MKRLFILAISLVALVPSLIHTNAANALSDAPWVDDPSFAHGGFYLDPTNCQIWTPEDGWHRHQASGDSMWVNYRYGPAGGFYWDPVSCQVWTSDAGWHTFNPAGIWPDKPADPCSMQLAAGATAPVAAGCMVTGDVKVSYNSNGPWEDLSYDKDPKTGTLVLVDHALWVQAPHGASVQNADQLKSAVEQMYKNGCENGCSWVNVTVR